MPAPNKFQSYPTAESVDDALKPISETIQPKSIPSRHHTNTEHITSLSPPKVAPKFHPHGQDGPKRKITPILTAPAYTSPQRTRRFGKSDNAFVAEVRLKKTPSKNAVEIFDSSKMRAPKLIRPPGSFSGKIEEVKSKDMVEGDDSAKMKIESDGSKMSPVLEAADSSTKSLKESTKGNISESNQPTSTATKQIPEEISVKPKITPQKVSTISENISPTSSVSPESSREGSQTRTQAASPKTPTDFQGQKSSTASNPAPLAMQETRGVISGMETSKTEAAKTASETTAATPEDSKLCHQKQLRMPEIASLDNVSTSKLVLKNQSESQPILTTTETSGNRFQTIAISVAGPKGSDVSGQKDSGSDELMAKGQTQAPAISKEVFDSTQKDAGTEVLDQQQNLDSEDSISKEVPKDSTTILQDSQNVKNTNSLGTKAEGYSGTTKDASKNQNDKGSSAVSVITITKPKGIVSKDVGVSSQAKTTIMENTQTDQTSCEDSTHPKTKHGISETPSGNGTRKSASATIQEQISEIPSLSIPQDIKRKTSLQIMNTATDKKRRDSVAYLPTRPAPTATKQRRVSLAANPSIPKRRISVQQQFSTKSQTTQFSHRLSNFLLEKGLNYKVEEMSLKLEIPVFKISQDSKEITIADEASIHDAVRSSKSSITILNDPGLNTEFLSVLKKFDTADSIKLNAPLTESVTKSQSEDKHKDEKETPQTIESLMMEMNENSTDYEIQLKCCQIIGKFVEEESIKVLINKRDIIQGIFTAIKTFQDRQSLQIAACMSLLKIASISESNCVMIKDCEGLTILNTIFKCYNDNITVQNLILTTWAYMSATESLCNDMLNYGIHSEVLETMSRRSDNSSVVKQCCFILANLVNTEETAKQIMLVGGVHTVINVIEKYHQDSAILENGCRALGSFAAFDETCLDVAQAGAMKTVVSILHDTLDNVTVQECSLWALACLTSIGETCEEVIELEVDEAVLDTMEKYPLEVNIQEYGVRIISNLASIESTSSEISCRRVLDILLKLLTNYSHNLCVLEHTFVIIGQTVLTLEDQKYLLESEGVRQIIRIMEDYNEQRSILEHGCRIIGNMAVFEKLRIKLECYGASRVVINAMLVLDRVPEIQLCGCMALMNLTANVHTNKLNVMKHGGVSAILSCLDNFTTDSEILLTALKTLTNIICLEGVCRSVVENNGVHLLLSVANTTSLDKEIHIYIATVLSGLTLLKELEFDIMEKIDTTLMEIINLYSDNVDICLAFCQAMENILVSESGRQLFICEDRLSLILKYTTQFIYHEQIQQIGCKIIAIIAMDKGNNQVITPDCVKCLLSMSIIHHDNLELQILTCGALSCILESNNKMNSVVLEENGIDQIISSLNKHSTDSRLHVLALMILANLATSVKQDKRKEIYNMVLKTMEQFTENAEIQSYACQVLCRVSTTDSEQVSRVLNSIRSTLKRHAQEEEVVKAASEVLRQIAQDGYKGEVDSFLQSSTIPQLPDYFWQSVKNLS